MISIFNKKPRLQQRIEILQEKMEFIYKWIPLSKVSYLTETLSLSLGIFYNHYFYTLDTKLGKRTIIITDKNKLKYCEYRKISKQLYSIMPYSDKLLLSYKSIFEIKIDNNKIDVSPCPMLDLTAHDIDLAILEFENAIEQDLQQAIKNYEKHNKCIKELNK